MFYSPPVPESNDRSGLRGRRKNSRYFTSRSADLPTGNNSNKASVVPRMMTPLATMFSIILSRTTNERKARQARKAPIDASTKGIRCPYRSFVRTGPDRPINQYTSGFTIITRVSEYDAATPTGPQDKPKMIDAMEIGAFIIDHCSISRERP